MTGAQSFGVFPDSSSQISSDSNQQPGDSVADGSALDKDKEMSALFFTDVEEKTTRARVDDETYARINLSETSTFVLLDIPVVCISDEDPNIGKIKETNEKYHEVILILKMFSQIILLFTIVTMMLIMQRRRR